jgi:predicted nicotinamide N-methyase
MPIDPLVFQFHQQGVPDALQIKLHLVDDEADTDQHDTGFVMWPAAVVLARWLGMHPSLLLSSAAKGNVLEIGAGCGLVGLTAATLIQHAAVQQRSPSEEEKNALGEVGNLIFSDYNPTVLENLKRNIGLNNLDGCAQVVGLDFFDQEDGGTKYNWVDMDGDLQPQVDLVLAAEVLAYSNDAVNVANTIWTTLKEGGHAIVVSPDESRRFGVEAFPDALEQAGLQVHVLDNLLDIVSFDSEGGGTAASDQERLIEDLEKTVGYNKQGYVYSNLKMFIIEKPNS